jgi:hypothetical protein
VSVASRAESEQLFGARVFSTASWKGYVQAALAYMLTDRFEGAQDVRAALHVDIMSSAPGASSAAATPSASSASSSSQPSQSDRPRRHPGALGLRFFVSSPGRLQLSHAGGISSSAALTGAISLALVSLFSDKTGWMARKRKLDVLASVDYGEYFLGKMAGAADKMAQLYAQKGCVTVISSLPESLRRTVQFPEALLSLLVVSAPVPRLTLPLSRSFLSVERGYVPEHVARAQAWAEETMASFGSCAYVQAVEWLRRALQDQEQLRRVGLSAKQGALLAQALVTHPALEYVSSPSEREASSATAAAAAAAVSSSSSSSSSSTSSPPPPTPCSYKLGLLRELCHGGSLESLASAAGELGFAPAIAKVGACGAADAAWASRHARYQLLYRALKLLPERMLYAGPKATRLCVLHLRKAALYGMAEVERGQEYLRCMDDIARLQRLQQQQQQQQQQLQTGSTGAATITATVSSSATASAAPALPFATASAADLSVQLSARVQRVLQLCALCHDGDRATVDYRSPLPEVEVPTVESYLAGAVANPCPGAAASNAQLAPPACSARFFAPTPWASSPRNDCSDAAIDRWIASLEHDHDEAAVDGKHSSSIPAPQELSDLPGGFERGLTDVDDMADEVARRFATVSTAGDGGGYNVSLGAALRISAAGLGGRVCVHVLASQADALATFLRERGWDVRQPVPSAPTQTIALK